MKKFALKVQNGKLRGVNLEALSDYLTTIEGKDIVLTIDTKKDQRSAEQNAYYWAAIAHPFYLFLKDKGFEEIKDREDAHEVLKLRCNSRMIGKERISKPTHNLTVEEFAEYITRCEVYLTSIGVDFGTV